MEHIIDSLFYSNFSSKKMENNSAMAHPIYIPGQVSHDTFLQDVKFGGNCSNTAASLLLGANVSGNASDGGNISVVGVTFPPLTYIYITVTIVDILVFITGLLGNVLVLLVIGR